MYDWGLVRDSQKQKRDRDGERQREAKRGTPPCTQARARLSLRAGTRGHGHARTQMHLRAARHADTHLRISRRDTDKGRCLSPRLASACSSRVASVPQRETERERE